ncbi:MAG: orotidine-5'-phosphate decarboxylase [Saprospiraceae bacterium]|nr:orotidine-5'-phosphate decarboxylase [Saprospiraceae bacterium]MBK9721533.1 orotidine-5'-phosphate decarboxylase [Saprospiraceae bacterium]
MMKSKEFISEQIYKKKSLLCVGLDPDKHKISKFYLDQENSFFDFCKDIIECTHDLAIAYKINIAFFEAQGPKGWLQLEKIFKIIPSTCFIIADAKRADIGNTSKQYASYYFDTLAVDAITLHPYMGVDSLEPFLEYKEKWSIILALTSNPGSKDFELQSLHTGKKLYENVIETFVESKYSSNIMFVCGATHPSEFIKIRSLCPDHFLLVPGIGEQGGDLKSTVEFGQNKFGGLLINLSRKVIYPESFTDYKTTVRQLANEYRSEMFKYLKTYSAGM